MKVLAAGEYEIYKTQNFKSPALKGDNL